MVSARMITRMRCLSAAATMAYMTRNAAAGPLSVARGGAIDEQCAACHNGLAHLETLAHLDEAVGGHADIDQPRDDGLVVGPRDPDAGLRPFIDHRFLGHRGHELRRARHDA